MNQENRIKGKKKIINYAPTLFLIFLKDDPIRKNADIHRMNQR